MMIRYLFILIVGVLLGSGMRPAQNPVPPDTLIELRRFSDAFGNGPEYLLTISYDGTIVFRRFRNPGAPGFDQNAPEPKPIESKVPHEKVSYLISEFERIKYFSLKDRYAKIEDGCPALWTDQGGVEISITINGKTKSVSHYYGCKKDPFGPAYPVELTELEKRIDDVVGTQQWLK